MVETISPKEDEPITSEEVINHGEDLVENKDNPANALKILKILRRKEITPDMLTGTKIGKKLAIIADEPNPEKGDNDLELLQELREMKAYLRKKWSAVYKKFKKQKSIEEVKEKEVPKQKKEKFEIPYIPKEM